MWKISRRTQAKLRMERNNPPPHSKAIQRAHTYSEGHRLPSVLTLLLFSVGQNPLQQHLSQLFLPRVLSFHQGDGLGQGGPLPPHQPPVESVQQPLLGSTQALDLLV